MNVRMWSVNSTPKKPLLSVQKVAFTRQSTCYAKYLKTTLWTSGCGRLICLLKSIMFRIKNMLLHVKARVMQNTLKHPYKRNPSSVNSTPKKHLVSDQKVAFARQSTCYAKHLKTTLKQESELG